MVGGRSAPGRRERWPAKSPEASKMAPTWARSADVGAVFADTGDVAGWSGARPGPDSDRAGVLRAEKIVPTLG